MIKAIIFDCFGVLTVDLWREFVGTLPEDQKQPAKDINHSYDAGHTSEKEFLAQIQKLTGRTPGQVEQQSLDQTHKNFTLLKYIAKLKVEYKIGLLSNIASGWIRESFLTKEEQGLFDEMVFSYEVGMTKPDPRIFNLACKRLGVESGQAVMIDDIEPYCEAAKSTGMHAVPYQNFAQMKSELEKILEQG